MHTDIKKKIKIILGNFYFDKGPSKIFNSNVIQFLDVVSKQIITDKKLISHPDLISFGFWCRKSNILRIKENYPQNQLMMGRGTVLHICPSNIPLNYAYSLVFGLLSGNNNIVRLPSKNFIQTNLLNKILLRILNNKKFIPIKKTFCLIKYEKSRKVSSELSKNVNARLIWGGDTTIGEFKSYYTLPRCVDLCFSNRFSISVINKDKILKLNKDQLNILANNFYNDCYTMDQQGCSSPKAIFWISKNKVTKTDNFWIAINKIIKKKYNDDLAITNKKIVSISNIILSSKLNIEADKKNFCAIRLKTKKLDQEIEKIQCQFGTFIETNLSSIGNLKKVITGRYQTLTYYGFTKEYLQKCIINNNFSGIDRVVPVGRAFDMGPIWDGYDIIYSLSRTIGE